MIKQTHTQPRPNQKQALLLTCEVYNNE